MSYLWVTVQDNVFDARRSVWGGPELQSFKAARDSIISKYMLCTFRYGISNPQSSPWRWY
jgi:hypothetical protein